MGAGWMVNTVVLVFTLIAGLVVFLRLITRGVLMRNAGLEDVFSTLAMVASVGLAITIAVQIQHGMSEHISILTEDQVVASQKAFWASLWIYNVALTSTKLSIVIQYLRIFPNARFRLVCFVAIGVISVWGAWAIFGNIYICLPVSFFWDKKVLGGHCLDQKMVFFTNATMNIIQDVLILIMPIPVLRSLSIPAKQKRVLISVFLCGGLVPIISVVRLKPLGWIADSTDPTFDNLPTALLSAIEVNIGIICACLPSMRPLLSAMMPSYFPDVSRYSNVPRAYDEERVKDLQTERTSVTYPSRVASRGYHSRHGSNSQPYTPHGRGSKSSQYTRVGSGYNSRSVSRAENYQVPTEITYHAKTTSQPKTLSRNNSVSSNRGPQRIAPAELENLYRRPSDPTSNYTRSHSRNNSNGSNRAPSPAHLRNNSEPYISQATLMNPNYGIHGLARRPSLGTTASVHQQHHLHPLRLSPQSPVLPTLPSLPENMAAFDPFQRPLGSPLGPPHTPRRLVFHKPLPVTPYPIPVGAEEESETEEVVIKMERPPCDHCTTGICTLHLVVQDGRKCGRSEDE
ncbi:hypothetical protein P280DRAFT_519485 [Massarina eburnea CBS 473.64]|uniref:Rhodopsin domain-containing protein n=1 Tax=Massarina eburnea CBS 473.64 TaxID=1395130 RepID=A0A6A6RZB3_9PLEO|nr:hypothetical protein P280DRAFT_519485 [Massarina eburnea CBS 473.64]